MARTIYPVILSGGSGTRLWPLSRDLLPKQLLSLVGPESLMAATARRVSGDGFAGPVIVCNQDHRFLVEEQLAAIGIVPEAIVIEPVARNTAPAIAAAAALLQARDPGALMLVLPSDHLIRDLPALSAAIATAALAAEAGKLVTFGITPTAPETGYGYIRQAGPVESVPGAFKIERFVEKPDLATAAGYLAEGEWSWNSGMFVFPADLMLEELAEFEPAIAAGAAKSVEAGTKDGVVLRLNADLFGAVPSKSIDYALMEKTGKSAIVPANLGWSDIGSWSALWEIGDKDHTANVTIGDVMTEDTEGSYLRSTGPLIATLGLKDVIMVATGDVVMVAAKDRAQDVKRFVNRLKSSGRTESVSHATLNLPWGTVQSLDSGENYRVRRLTVKPGARPSLKKHAQRAKHWVVVNGKALVTRDDETVTLDANMSIAIPAGAAHRVQNIGDAPLELIEVQSGAYLGDDDLIRLSDDYGRT
jgi:mannose-1-phosphate guanylyltransferase/mannose-1-phosphate guanylyltransferase/mannose-6-phosphate isomerase